jgi:flagellar hook-associated protein 3 FlgL
MRVTNGMMVNNMMRNITRNYSRMDKLQEMMATGKKFNRPSDDPIGVSRSLRLNTEVATMGQYKRNVDDTVSWLSSTEMAMDNIGEILKRAKELTVQAASDTNSVNERNAIAGEIKELRNQLVQIANTTYAGSYIFSGFKTDKPLLKTNGEYDIGGGKLTGDEVIETNVGIGDRMGMNSIGQRIFGLCLDPLTDLDLTTSDSIAQHQSMKSKYLSFPIGSASGTITFEMTYGGNTENISLAYPINTPGALVTNLTGELNTAFGLGEITADIVDNKLVLESDNGEFFIGDTATDLELIGLESSQISVSRVESGDKSQLIAIFDTLVDDGLAVNNSDIIREAMSRIDAQINNINAVRGEIGVKTNRAELTNNRILDDTINLTDLLSKNEDADMTEVIINVKMQENVYRASLSTGARIIQPSLVDFLR